MGNSEVGHLNIGAGRVVLQDLPLIDHAIKTRALFTNPILVKALTDLSQNHKALHLLGLVSDGGVHSHLRHYEPILELAAKFNVKVFIHAFLDGRDTSPKSAINYLSLSFHHRKRL